MASWTDDYYRGSSDYPLSGDEDDATLAHRDPYFEPSDDKTLERNEDAS